VCDRVITFIRTSVSRNALLYALSLADMSMLSGIIKFITIIFFFCTSQEGENPQYKDEIDCFKQLVTKEGPGSLYSGLVPQLLGIAPEKVL